MDWLIQYIRNNTQWIFSGIGVAVLTVLVWLFRRLLSPKPKVISVDQGRFPEIPEAAGRNALTNHLGGTLRLPIKSLMTYEVFYPRPFARPPCLTLRCTEGGSDLEMIQQRADGFKFQTGTSSWGTSGIVVEWIAEGEFVPRSGSVAQAPGV